MLEIREDKDRHQEGADFGVRVDSDRLHVPLEVAALLRSLSVRNAEQFVAYLQTYPSAFTTAFRWAPDDLEVARTKLISELRGHVNAAALDYKPARFRPGMGALPPPARSRK